MHRGFPRGPTSSGARGLSGGSHTRRDQRAALFAVAAWVSVPLFGGHDEHHWGRCADGRVCQRCAPMHRPSRVMYLVHDVPCAWYIGELPHRCSSASHICIVTLLFAAFMSLLAILKLVAWSVVPDGRRWGCWVGRVGVFLLTAVKPVAVDVNGF